MIVATHLGMFMPALRPDWEKCIERGEPELQVRSRRQLDLDSLRTFAGQFGIELGPTIQLKNTDYQFRAYCTRGQWGGMLAQLALDIDYVKFKDTPEKYHGDKKLTRAYEAMWGAIFTAFSQGSRYGWPRNHGRARTARPADEVIFRTERNTSSWTMKGSTPEQMAALMREIDEATAGVVLPTDDELDELDAQAEVCLNDHTACTHGDSKSARRRCRQKRLDA